MDDLFLLLMLVSLTFLIIGFFNPLKSLFWDKQERTKRRSARIYGGLAFIFFVLFGITSDDPKTEMQKVQKKETQAVVSSNESTSAPSEKLASVSSEEPTSDPPKLQAPDIESLFGSADEFKTSFNKNCREIGLEFRIRSINIKQLVADDMFTYTINDNIALNGVMYRKSGGVKELAMIGTGDGTFVSGGNLIMCMIAIVASVDSSLSKDSRVNVLRKLRLIGDKTADIKDLSEETVLNGIKYSVISNSTMGLWFIVAVDN